MDCFAEPVVGRRFAPTRWLAMTVSKPLACWLFEKLKSVVASPSCHHPRKRVIQYSETSVMEWRGRGVLDTPLARGMTAVCGERLFEN
jgi:hypothetical protein